MYLRTEMSFWTVVAAWMPVRRKQIYSEPWLRKDRTFLAWKVLSGE
jgi:hypothetical protein